MTDCLNTVKESLNGCFSNFYLQLTITNKHVTWWRHSLTTHRLTGSQLLSA